MRRIVLSGGWGYGNLGDYAILIALVKRLLRIHPSAEIIVTSFAPDETRRLLHGFPVYVVKSAHRILWGKHPYRELQIYHRSSSWIPPGSGVGSRIRGKMYSRILQYWGFLLDMCALGFLVLNGRFIPGESCLQSADVFILAGGGYLNRWKGAFLSHMLELSVAKRNGIRVCLAGPTIGPFDDWQYRYLRKYASCIVSAVVRDEKSREEAARIGFMTSVGPDLAMLDRPSTQQLSDTLILVPGDIPFEKQDVLIQTVVEKCKYYGWRVRVVVTRLYSPDVYFAARIVAQLKALIGVVEYELTENYDDIVRQLSDGRIVVSWNLHGMILAWRAGLSCVCLNEGRKFATFMSQTGQIAQQVPWRTLSVQKLSEAIDLARLHYVEFPVPDSIWAKDEMLLDTVLSFS